MKNRGVVSVLSTCCCISKLVKDTLATKMLVHQHAVRIGFIEVQDNLRGFMRSVPLGSVTGILVVGSS